MKRDFIPESKFQNLNFETKITNNPKDCFDFCNEIGPNCKIVEYYKDKELCRFYSLSNLYTTFYNNNKIIKTNVSKEECINMFNNEPNSNFFQYKNDINTECSIVTTRITPEDINDINQEDFKLDFNLKPNVKYQTDEEVVPRSDKTKEGAKENNFIPYLLVGIGIFGIFVISFLIAYGVKMITKSKAIKHVKNSKSARNKIAYKIKNAETYNKNKYN